MLYPRFENGYLVHSTRVTDLPICLADSYPSYYKVAKGSNSNGPIIRLYSRIHHNHDPDLFGYDLIYDNERRVFKCTNTPIRKETKILEDFKSFGFNPCSNSSLTLEIFQDQISYISYSIKFVGETPSDEFLYYFFLKHKSTFHISDNEMTILQKFKRESEKLPSIPGWSLLDGLTLTKIGSDVKEFSDLIEIEDMPIKSPVKKDWKELKMTTPQFCYKCDLKEIGTKNWVIYSLQHFYENIHLLGYPVEIEEKPYQWGEYDSIHHFKWLEKVPPKELLSHVFNDTCYAIGDGYLCINKWPHQNILNADKKCECIICNYLRKNNDYTVCSGRF